MEKEMLRTLMKSERKALTEADVIKRSKQIFEKLSDMQIYKSAKSVCVYMDSFNEVKTDLIIEDLRKQKKDIIFPITDKNTKTLSLCKDCGSFKKGAYGILEPTEWDFVDFDFPDLIIIPGLAFDITKNRLGFGAGYYDKLLEKSEAKKIGICYDFQISEKIEVEEHDVKMDIVISEKRIVM